MHNLQPIISVPLLFIFFGSTHLTYEINQNPDRPMHKQMGWTYHLEIPHMTRMQCLVVTIFSTLKLFSTMGFQYSYSIFGLYCAIICTLDVLQLIFLWFLWLLMGILESGYTSSLLTFWLIDCYIAFTLYICVLSLRLYIYLWHTEGMCKFCLGCYVSIIVLYVTHCHLH